MVKVSSIVPVYNTAKYLSECLDSIIGQTLKDIEIICIDDGSVDESPQILDFYAEKDSRIKVIHKENGGRVAARNDGVRAAQGKYTGYVDSDDGIDPQMFKQLYDRAEQSGADLVTSGYWLDKIRDGSRVVLYGGGEIEYNADIHKYDADMHDGVSP